MSLAQGRDHSEYHRWCANEWGYYDLVNSDSLRG